MAALNNCRGEIVKDWKIVLFEKLGIRSLSNTDLYILEVEMTNSSKETHSFKDVVVNEKVQFGNGISSITDARFYHESILETPISPKEITTYKTPFGNILRKLEIHSHNNPQIQLLIESYKFV